MVEYDVEVGILDYISSRTEVRVFAFNIGITRFTDNRHLDWKIQLHDDKDIPPDKWRELLSAKPGSSLNLDTEDGEASISWRAGSAKSREPRLWINTAARRGYDPRAQVSVDRATGLWIIEEIAQGVANEKQKALLANAEEEPDVSRHRTKRKANNPTTQPKKRTRKT